VVGRTGSGKSTLMLSLVRAVCSNEGAIKIDGKDINSMPLNELRMSMNVILQ
jgi:ABC-type multidrug transport system fused ATPase/permease subunit